MRAFKWIQIFAFCLICLYLVSVNAISTIQVFIDHHVVDYDVVFFYVIMFGVTCLAVWMIWNNVSLPGSGSTLQNRIGRISLRTILLSIFFLLLSLCIYMFVAPNTIFSSPVHKLWLALFFSLSGQILLSNGWRQTQESVHVFVPFLLFAVGLFASEKISFITDYPLSLSWSETAHFNYGYAFYSAFTGKNEILLPYMNHSRYLLLSIPWFFSTENILFHRLWETLLTLITPALTAFLVVRYFIRSSGNRIIFSLLVFLIIIQGPIYYHLLLIPIILFWKPDASDRLKMVLLFVTSVWAGFSRINWLPMPAAIMILIYLLETRLIKFDSTELMNFLKTPVIYAVIGLLGGLMGYGVIYLLPNTPKEILSSAFSSPLIFARLFNSPGIEFGTIYEILILIIPMLLVILFTSKQGNYSKIQILAISAIYNLFFAGSVIVSAKIGGGSGIHNFDTFILLMVIIFIFSAKELNLQSVFQKRLFIGFALCLLVPWMIVVLRTNSKPDFDHLKADQLIEDIQIMIDTNEKVFLGTEQHLILMNQITGIEYQSNLEKTLIMEAVMSDNDQYLQDHILIDIENKAYDLLILETQPKYIKTVEETFFSEENNRMLINFTESINANYELLELDYSKAVEIYTPIED